MPSLEISDTYEAYYEGREAFPHARPISYRKDAKAKTDKPVVTKPASPTPDALLHRNAVASK